MKGLLLKDWYSSWKENKVVFVVVAAFLAVQTINGSFIFAMMAPIMITSLGTAIFTRDEYSGWLQFARTLPLSGRQIIGERYLFILLLDIPVVLLEWAALSFSAPDSSQAAFAVITALTITNTMTAFMLYYLERFGAAKLRIVTMITIIVLASIGMIAVDLNVGGSLPTDTVTLSMMFIAGSFLLLLLSYALSVRHYSQKRG